MLNGIESLDGHETVLFGTGELAQRFVKVYGDKIQIAYVVDKKTKECAPKF